MLASFSDYVPLDDLAKIVAACLLVAVIAPAAVAVAVNGLDVRARRGEGAATGTALVVLGVAVLAALVAAGIYALFTD